MERYWGAMTAAGYTREEVAADAAIHAAGLAFALIAGPALVWTAAARQDGWVVAAVVVYVLTMVAMFAFSALYNLVPHPGWQDTLRRLDHAGIYLKIAGSYTPLAAAPLAAGPGWALLSAVWAVASIGLLGKLLGIRRLDPFSIPLYLGLGWALVWVWDDVQRLMSGPGLALLALGGLLYTFGIVFHLWRRLPFQNAIWHLHVLAATACLYAAIAVEIA